jgi:hypothetical protein
MSTRRQVWTIGRYVPFKTSFDRLSPQDKWYVEHAINELTFDRTPEQHYPSVQCPECGMSSVHLAAIAHDGLGNMGVELQFNVDRQFMILTPIFTRRTKLFNANQLNIR